MINKTNNLTNFIVLKGRKIAKVMRIATQSVLTKMLFESIFEMYYLFVEENDRERSRHETIVI